MKKQKNKLAGLQRRKAISGYIFISPFLIGFLVFMIRPLLHSLYMGFCKVGFEEVNSKQVLTMSWTGLENLNYIFRIDPDFTRFLVEDIGKLCLYSVAIMVFSFFVALILNQRFKGRALVRAVFFLPVIISSGVMLGLEESNSLMNNIQQNIQDAGVGVSITATLQDILRTAGVGIKAYEKLFEVMDNIYDIAISSGIQIIIFLSGLQTISTSMYEAADIEGCTKWESLWKITFPMVSPLFLVNWVYTVIDFCMRSDSDLQDKIMNTTTQQFLYGRSSAMAWVYFMIVIGILGISSLIISRRVYYYE